MAQKFTVPVTIKNLSSAGSDGITVFLDQETYARLKVEAGGRITWGDGSGAGDTNLYRDAANALKTDDSFQALGGVITLATSGSPSASIADGALAVDTVNNEFYFRSNSQWVKVGVSVTMDDLEGVVVTSPEEYQVIQYDGTNWVNDYPDTVSYVRNVDTVTLNPGTAVYLFGGNGDHATVKRADNSSDTTSSKTLGLVGGGGITVNNNGPVVTRGYVDGMDLSAYSPGDVLWLGKNGAFTTTKPSAPDHLVFLGVVIRATNNGIIYVAAQNGYELDELHNVKINGVSDGQFLRYNSASAVWVNDTINLGTDTAGNYMLDVSASTGLVVSHTQGEGSTATITLNATLDNLSDVSVPSPTNGDYLKFNGSSWVSASIQGGGGGGSITVSDTAPVSPSEGDLWYDSINLMTFIYYSSAWVDLDSTEPQFTELESLVDVLISNPTPNQFLKYNGTEWVNSNLTIEDTDDLPEGSTNLYFTNARAKSATNDALVAGTGLQKSYNAGSNTVTLNMIATTDDVSEGSTRLYFTNERAHDAINELFVAGTGVTKQYDDNGNTLTILIGQDVATSASPTFSAVNISNGIVFEGVTQDSYETTLVVADPTADRTITFPNITGTVAIAESTFNTQTENYTLALSDKDKLVEMNKSSANIITVPPNSSVAFPIGSKIDVFQYGTGKTQIQGGSGVNIRATPGAYLRAQYASATLIKRATDEWILIGDLSAS